MSLPDQLAEYLLTEAGHDLQCPITPTLVTQERCIPCQEAKEALKDQIASGEVRVISIDKPESVQLMAQAGLDMLPQLFMVDCKGKIVKELDMGDLGMGGQEEYETPEVDLDADSMDQEILRALKNFVSGRSK